MAVAYRSKPLIFLRFKFYWKCREMLLGMELAEDKRVFNKLRGLTGYQCKTWILFGFREDVATGAETLAGD